MKIATWNVNSIRQRERHVGEWLGRNQPDLLLLQEIKCEAGQFPAGTFEALGYRAEIVGQKTFNGVAVLGRVPFEVTERCLPGMGEDTHARYLEVTAEGLVAGNLYLPNGNSRGDEGFAYKIRWMECLAEHAAALFERGVPFLLAGDYNVCPADEDFAPGTLPEGDALIRPESRAQFRRLLWLGLTDAVRAVQPSGKVYTFWDYQAGAWRRDAGLRIDHALLSPELAERLVSAAPDRDERDQPQPSDHVPVTVTLGN